MNRRTFLYAPLAALAMAQQVERRPNILWLFSDQQRAHALGLNGDPNARTPNIDQIAQRGANFTDAVSGYPLCCPFRGSLVTGRHPHHCVPGHEHPLPAGQETIAHVLGEAGYQTAWFGKWHLDGWHEYDGRAAFHIVPPERRGGFETWVGYENNNSQYDCWVHGGTGKDAFHYRLPGYETDELTNLLIKYLKDRGAEQGTYRRRPFFAVLSVQPPHDPYVAPKDFVERYDPARLQLRPNVPAVKSVVETVRKNLAGYYAMIENWDWNIGRIRQALSETGLAADTRLMIFSDHGDMHGSNGQFHKTTPFEEAIKIPFIIGGEQPTLGSVTGSFPALLNSVDIAPTTLGLCGIAKPGWMEGKDFSTYHEPDSAYLQNVIPTGHPDSTNKPYRGLITRDGWKYVAFANTSWLMFDLNDDPYEQVNLAHNNKARVQRKKLIARLRQWISDTGDQFELPDN